MTTSVDRDTTVAISSSRIFESNERESCVAGSFDQGIDEHDGQTILRRYNPISSQPLLPSEYPSQGTSPPGLPPGLPPPSSALQPLTTSSRSLSSSTAPAKKNDISTAASPLFPTAVSTPLSSPLKDVSTTAHPPLLGATLSRLFSFSTKIDDASPTTCPLPSAAPGNPLSSLPSINTYCLQKNIRAQQIDLLDRANNGFIESQKLDLETFAELLKIWSRVCHDESIPRLQRLSQGLTKFVHHFTRLLGILYWAHEVTARPKDAVTSRSKGLDLAQGETPQTAAFRKIATALDISLDAVKAEYKRSKNYLLLLEEEGPGILLQIGTGVDSIWETKLAKDDVRILLQYRAKHQGHLRDQARAQDIFVSRLILDGMVAYGWSYRELAKSRSRLVDRLGHHINLDELADLMEGLKIAQPFPYPRMGEGSYALEDGIQGKRQHDDSDNEEHAVKRVQLSKGLEGPEISTMISLWPMPEEPDISAMIPLSPMPGQQEIGTMMEPFWGLDLVQPQQVLDLDMPHRQQMDNCADSQPKTQWSQEFGDWELLALAKSPMDGASNIN